MGKVGRDVYREAVKVTQRLMRMPSAAILASVSPSPTQIPMRPSARCAETPSSAKVEMIQPSSEWTRRRTSLAALLKVEHDVADALAGAVIGVPAAASRRRRRETRLVEQFGGVGAGAGGEQRRVFEQPDAFGRLASADRRRPLLHERMRFLVWDEAVADAPFDVARSCTSARWPLAASAASALQAALAASITARQI